MLLLEVSKRKIHRFFLVTKFFSVHLPTGLRRPFCRVEDYLKPCSSTDKSCLSTIKSRISRQSQKSCQNQRIKKSLKHVETKFWKAMLDRFAFVEPWAFIWVPRKVHLRIRDHPSGPCWDPSRSESEDTLERHHNIHGLFDDIAMLQQRVALKVTVWSICMCTGVL